MATPSWLGAKTEQKADPPRDALAVCPCSFSIILMSWLMAKETDISAILCAHVVQNPVLLLHQLADCYKPALLGGRLWYWMPTSISLWTDGWIDCYFSGLDETW